jgi:hypothetical protein
MAFLDRNVLSVIAQAATASAYFIFMITSRRCPLRARKTMEFPGAAGAHPQWVSRWKLNLRGRTHERIKRAAVAATTIDAVISCQSIP